MALFFKDGEAEKFFHVNLCILIRMGEKDKNVNGFLLKIKEFQNTIANNVNSSL